MNYGELGLYNTAQGLGGAPIQNVDIVSGLKAQRADFQRRLEKIDMLLALLEKNPDFHKMLELSRQLI